MNRVTRQSIDDLVDVLFLDTSADLVDLLRDDGFVSLRNLPDDSRSGLFDRVHDILGGMCSRPVVYV